MGYLGAPSTPSHRTLHPLSTRSALTSALRASGLNALHAAPSALFARPQSLSALGALSALSVLSALSTLRASALSERGFSNLPLAHGLRSNSHSQWEVSKAELSCDITTQRYWAEHCSPSSPTATPWQLWFGLHCLRDTPYSTLRKEVSSCSSLRLARGVEGQNPLRLLVVVECSKHSAASVCTRTRGAKSPVLALKSLLSAGLQVFAASLCLLRCPRRLRGSG